MSNPTIIITGANGYLGDTLVTYFRSKKWNVKAFVRNTPENPFSDVVYCNYEMDATLNESDFEDADFVVHAAYVKNEVNKNSDRINIESTQRLIDLCLNKDIKLVYLSSFSAHENAISHYGKHKLECEKLVDLNKDVILKIGFVIGKEGILAEIIDRMQNSSFFPLVGGGKQPLQTICIDDFSRTLERVLLNKELKGVFHVAHEKVITMGHFYKEIANLLEKKVSFIPVSISLLYVACKFFEAFKIKFPVSSENILGLKKLTTFDTKGDQQRLDLNYKDYKDSLTRVI